MAPLRLAEDLGLATATADSARPLTVVAHDHFGADASRGVRITDAVAPYRGEHKRFAAFENPDRFSPNLVVVSHLIVKNLP